MSLPIAILWELENSHELDVTPSTDIAAGTGFYDPQTNVFVIPARDLPSGTFAAARENGTFRCRKNNSADLFNVGDELSFLANGVASGSDPLVVSRPSAAGEKYVFALLNPPSDSIGGGLNTSQVNALIDGATRRSFIYNTFADDTAPVDADWPEGQAPQEGDILWVTRTPTTRRREEFWERGVSTDEWNQTHVVTDSASSTSEPKRSEFRADQDIPSGTPINMNAATPPHTSAVGLDYILHDPGTSATFQAVYGREVLAYVNGLLVQSDDILRNDGDPAGRIRFQFIVPADSDIVFESQVTT